MRKGGFNPRRWRFRRLWRTCKIIGCVLSISSTLMQPRAFLASRKVGADRRVTHGVFLDFRTQFCVPIYFFDGESCNFSKGGMKGGINDYLCYIKRECFKQEQEFRIVITVPNELLATLKEAGVYKFRPGNVILIPFLELTFSAEAVKSIMISPTVQSDLVELSIRDFLEYCDFDVEDYSRFIWHSKVPVRF